MKKKTFTEHHTAATSAIAVVVWFVTLFLLSVLTSCKSGNPNIVTIVTTDTLHVYHTDTLKVVHNDTVYSVKVETKHDSIIIKEKYYLDAEGNVTLTEKEKESWHDANTDFRLIQHTVDSLVQAKVDSIYQSKYHEKPVVVEVEKPTPWYTKAWNWIVGKFAWIGVFAFIAILAYFVVPRIIDKMKPL